MRYGGHPQQPVDLNAMLEHLCIEYNNNMQAEMEAYRASLADDLNALAAQRDAARAESQGLAAQVAATVSRLERLERCVVVLIDFLCSSTRNLSVHPQSTQRPTVLPNIPVTPASGPRLIRRSLSPPPHPVQRRSHQLHQRRPRSPTLLVILSPPQDERPGPSPKQPRSSPNPSRGSSSQPCVSANSPRSSPNLPGSSSNSPPSLSSSSKDKNGSKDKGSQKGMKTAALKKVAEHQMLKGDIDRDAQTFKVLHIPHLLCWWLITLRLDHFPMAPPFPRELDGFSDCSDVSTSQSGPAIRTAV